MATTTRAATEADLMAQPPDGNKYELVDGAIRASPAGARHGNIAVRLASRLLAFADQGAGGHVVDSSTGFRLPSGNVRLPDVAYIAPGRFANEQPPDDFPSFAPDLAVEILCPSDSARYVLNKVGEYLESGTRLVWVLDPSRRTASVWRSLMDVHALQADDMLEGGDVLPGFRCRLSEIL